jgi:hypothetical protein
LHLKNLPGTVVAEEIEAKISAMLYITQKISIEMSNIEKSLHRHHSIIYQI